MDLAKEILNAIQNSTPSKPTTLCDIIGCVDAQMKIRISYNELINALKELFAQDKIGQIGDDFFDLENVDDKEKYLFVGLTEEKFDMADKRYEEEFQKIYRNLSQGNMREKKWKWE